MKYMEQVGTVSIYFEGSVEDIIALLEWRESREAENPSTPSKLSPIDEVDRDRINYWGGFPLW